eukprot:5968774-Prymnesium_polylepis.1
MERQPPPPATVDGAPKTLDALPVDVLVAVLAAAASTANLGRAACVCRAFRHTLVLEALWRRAGAACSADEPLPPGEQSWMQLLCWRERRAAATRLNI